MRGDWVTAYAAMHGRGDASWPPACLYYVLEGVRKSARDTQEGAVTPREIIAGFRTRARADFGAFLPEVLEDWGLISPASLGQAVLALGRQGLLSLSPEDTLEAFSLDALSLAEMPEDAP